MLGFRGSFEVLGNAFLTALVGFLVRLDGHGRLSFIFLPYLFYCFICCLLQNEPL